MPQTIFCPGCGEGLPAGTAVCPACSTHLPESATETLTPGSTPGSHAPHGWMESPEPPRPVTPLPTTPPYQPPAIRQQQQPMPHCPGCGRPIPGNVLFCPQCGRNLQAAPPGFQPHQSVPPPFVAPPATAHGAQKQGKNEQLLIIILAVIAACIILGFFC